MLNERLLGFPGGVKFWKRPLLARHGVPEHDQNAQSNEALFRDVRQERKTMKKVRIQFQLRWEWTWKLTSTVTITATTLLLVIPHVETPIRLSLSLALG